jgi:hypothetical protein
MSEEEQNEESGMWSKNGTTTRIRHVELLHMETAEIGQAMTCEGGGQG